MVRPHRRGRRKNKLILACQMAFMLHLIERQVTRARTCATLAWTGSSFGSLREKIRSRAPSCSTAITSFRIKVCESRGQALTTYPTVGFLSGRGFIHSLSEKLRERDGRMRGPAQLYGFVANGVIISLLVCYVGWIVSDFSIPWTTPVIFHPSFPA